MVKDSLTDTQGWENHDISPVWKAAFKDLIQGKDGHSDTVKNAIFLHIHRDKCIYIYK